MTEQELKKEIQAGHELIDELKQERSKYSQTKQSLRYGYDGYLEGFEEYAQKLGETITLINKSIKNIEEKIKKYELELENLNLSENSTDNTNNPKVDFNE